MKLKAVSGIMLTLLLIGMSMLTLNIQQAHSSEPPPIEWSRTYEELVGHCVDACIARALVQTSDGGYAIAGYTTYESDMWPINGLLVKVDSAGNIQWNKTYRPHNEQQYDPYSLVETSDGGYAFAGHAWDGVTGIAFWLVKVDSAGNIQWSQQYIQDQFNRAYSLVETSDGGYAFAGTSSWAEGGWHRFWLVKVDSAGNIQWNKTYGGTESNVAYAGAHSVVLASDGGYAIAGWKISFDKEDADFWLVKTDSYGSIEWNQTYGGTNDDYPRSMIQTSDGGYAIIGKGFANLVKTDSDGNLLWNKTYEGRVNSVVETTDGGYALGGNKDGDGWLVKTDSCGNVKWSGTYGRPDAPVGCDSLVQTSDGGYAMAGTVYSPDTGDYVFCLAKISPVEYTITFFTDPAGPGFNITYQGQTYSDGESDTFPYDTSGLATANAPAGWEFDHWLLDDVDVGADDPYTLVMDANHTLTAVYRAGPQIPITIYIRADGSVDPSYAPISSIDNVTYTFTSNITGSIVVERNNTIVDGDGYTLSGEMGDAFTLSNINNVTIQNMNISAGMDSDGIVLSGVNNVIIQNICIPHKYGGCCIRFSESSFNIVSGNDLQATEGDVINLSDSPNNTISGNNVRSSYEHTISLYSSSFNNITGNNIEAHYTDGIFLYSSSFNSIYGNDLSGSEGSGIGLSNSSFNTISGNKLRNAGGLGVGGASSHNIISGNNITALWGVGICIYSSSNNTVCGNNVTGEDTGIELKSSSNYNVIYGNTVRGGSGWGGIFCQSSNNTIWQNDIAQNVVGVFIAEGASNNSIYDNEITNSEIGIRMRNAPDNYIFHNNFIDNTNQVDSENSINAWDKGYPSGGNYWSDYAGVDEYSGVNQDEPGHDGLGDTPYIIDQNNQDNYPFLRPGPQPPWIPISSFDYAPLDPVVNEAVTFDASASYDLEGYIVSYVWDFGDGTTATETDAVTTHSYMLPGTYPVTLNVTDDDGLMDTAAKTINIDKTPTSISISTSVPSTFVGFKVNITGSLQDTYGNCLEGETVVLYYTFSGITTWTPITSDITDNFGHYFTMWIPPATGYFVLKAEWSGNATYSGASNTTTLSSLVYQGQYVFSVESNSTISELAFNTKNWKLSFTATGPNGTRGYVKVTVTKSLATNITNIRVYMDGRQLEFSVTPVDDSWLLTFDYTHSTHQVVLDLDIDIIPEFSSFLVILLLMIATLLAVAAYRRKHSM